MTVLFIEHDMDTVHDISDWVVVMGEGKIIAEGTPDQVMADQRVIDAYLGAHHDGAVKTVAGRDVAADQVPVPRLDREPE
jgi:branched-chain amino acid transport system ATP-binding protein